VDQTQRVLSIPTWLLSLHCMTESRDWKSPCRKKRPAKSSPAQPRCHAKWEVGRRQGSQGGSHACHACHACHGPWEQEREGAVCCLALHKSMAPHGLLKLKLQLTGAKGAYGIRITPGSLLAQLQQGLAGPSTCGWAHGQLPDCLCLRTPYLYGCLYP
jgi:hypothetical protein